MKNPLSMLKVLTSFVRLVRDPNRLNEVFELANEVADPEAARPMVGAIADDPAGARALSERHRLGALDVDTLRKLPPGAFGRAFADHMIANRLDPGAIPTRAADDELSFVLAHLYETHDIWHVATGFSVDVAGELGLQAFYLAQLPGRLAPWILAAGILNTLLYQPTEWRPRLDAITRGWLLGKRSRPLFGVPWDELWDAGLDDVRTRLNLRVAEVDEEMSRTAPTGKQAANAVHEGRSAP